MSEAEAVADPERQRTPDLPPGRVLHIPGRGTTFVRDSGGPPGAPVVVLLHGWTVNSDVNWFPSFEQLGRQFRVIAFDQRGHGRGIRPANGLITLEDTADDVKAVCDELGVSRAVIVGYSMGGAVAQLVWRRSPSLVAGLVLCSTAAHFRVGQSSDLFFRGQAAASRMLRANPFASQWVMARSVNGKVDQGPYADWIRSELLRGDAALLLSAGAALGRFDSTGWLGDIDVPTAVVVTVMDRTVSPGRQAALAAAIPEVRTWSVDGPHNSAVTLSSAWVPRFVESVAHVARPR